MLGNINRLCKERGLSLSELERLSGINPKSIYRWDKNTPSADKVQKVANYFGVSIDELLREDTQEGG